MYIFCQSVKKKGGDDSKKSKMSMDKSNKNTIRNDLKELGSTVELETDIPNLYVSPDVRIVSIWHRLLWHILILLTNECEKEL